MSTTQIYLFRTICKTAPTVVNCHGLSEETNVRLFSVDVDDNDDLKILFIGSDWSAQAVQRAKDNNNGHPLF